MPTEEPKKILDREFSKAAVTPITELSTPLLVELVNAGLMIWRRCELEVGRDGRENEDVAAIVLYRHLIEMVDGIQVLIADSCGTSAIPVLRSAFEGTTSLLYLLSEDAKYVERSLAWLVAEVHAGIAARQLLDPSTARGQGYLQLYQKELGSVRQPVPKIALADEIRQMEASLQSSQLAPIEAEYQRVKAATRRTPNWFCLFGGPGNRADLAGQVGFGAMYQLLYADWSAVSHGTDLGRYLSGHGGRPAFDAVRRPVELQQIALFAAVLVLRASRAMINRFRKGENLEPWYVRDVKPLFDRLADLRIEFSPLVQE